MDAEHRHELKTNELAEWINHFPEFVKRNIWQIVGIICIIAGICSWFFIDRTKEARQEAQMAMATSTMQRVEFEKLNALGQMQSGEGDVVADFAAIANSLKTAAMEAAEPQQAALLLIKRGEALRADLHYNKEFVEDEVIESNIEKARVAYEQAMKKASGNKTLEALAKYGLGLCAEELGDFAKARELFGEIAANEDYKGTALPMQAQFRIDVMGDSEVEFVFVPAPEEPGMEGLDEAAKEAVERGQIYIEKPKTEEAKVEEDKTEESTTPEGSKAE